MTTKEQATAETLREGAAKGWHFLYLEGRNAIRAYNRHGVTIMTVDLTGVSEEAEAEYIDITL